MKTSKYKLTFERTKARFAITYSNGTFKKSEYLGGEIEEMFWSLLNKVIPFKEVDIGKKEKEYDNRIKFNEVSKITGSDFTNYLKAYFHFIEQQTGMKAKMNATEGASLKKIMQYLNEVSESQEEALNVWEQMLTNWNKLEPFYQNQLQLRQINSQLINILAQLKNGKPTDKARRQAKSDADAIRESI